MVIPVNVHTPVHRVGQYSLCPQPQVLAHGPLGAPWTNPESTHVQQALKALLHLPATERKLHP